MPTHLQYVASRLPSDMGTESAGGAPQTSPTSATPLSLPELRDRIGQLFQYSRPLSLGALVRLVPSATDLLEAHQEHIQRRILRRQRLNQLLLQRAGGKADVLIALSKESSAAGETYQVASKHPSRPALPSRLGPSMDSLPSLLSKDDTCLTVTQQVQESVGGDIAPEATFISLGSPISATSHFPVSMAATNTLSFHERLPFAVPQQASADGRLVNGNTLLQPEVEARSVPSLDTAKKGLVAVRNETSASSAAKDTVEVDMARIQDSTSDTPLPAPVVPSGSPAVTQSLTNEEVSRRLSRLLQRFHAYQLCELLHEQAERLGYQTYQDPTTNDIIATAASLRAREAAARQYVDAVLARLRAMPAPQTQPPRSPANAVDHWAPGEDVDGGNSVSQPWSEEELVALDKHIMSVLGCHHGKERHCPHAGRREETDDRRRQRLVDQQQQREEGRGPDAGKEYPASLAAHAPSSQLAHGRLPQTDRNVEQRSHEHAGKPRRKITAEELAVLLGAITAPLTAATGGIPTVPRGLQHHSAASRPPGTTPARARNTPKDFFYGGGATVTLIKPPSANQPPPPRDPTTRADQSTTSEPSQRQLAAARSLDALNGVDPLTPQRAERQRAVVAGDGENFMRSAENGNRAKRHGKQISDHNGYRHGSGINTFTSVSSLDEPDDDESSDVSTSSTEFTDSESTDLDSNDGALFPLVATGDAIADHPGSMDRGGRRAAAPKVKTLTGSSTTSDPRKKQSNAHLPYDSSSSSDDEPHLDELRGATSVTGHAGLPDAFSVSQTSLHQTPSPLQVSAAEPMKPCNRDNGATKAYVDSLLDVKTAASTRQGGARLVSGTSTTRHGEQNQLTADTDVAESSHRTGDLKPDAKPNVEHDIVVNTFASPSPLLEGYTASRPFTIHELTMEEAKRILALPRYAQTHQMNREANTRQRTCYRDPLHGVLVLTSDFLARFPHCFGEYCVHCPHGEVCWRQNAMFSYTRDDGDAASASWDVSHSSSGSWDASSQRSSASAGSSKIGFPSRPLGDLRTAHPTSTNDDENASSSSRESSPIMASLRTTTATQDLEPWSRVAVWEGSATIDAPAVGVHHVAATPMVAHPTDDASPLSIGRDKDTPDDATASSTLRDDREASVERSREVVAAAVPSGQAAVYYAGQWSVSTAGVIINANSIEDILRWELTKPVSHPRRSNKDRKHRRRPRQHGSGTEGDDGSGSLPLHGPRQPACALASRATTTTAFASSSSASSFSSSTSSRSASDAETQRKERVDAGQSVVRRVASLEKFSYLDFASL